MYDNDPIIRDLEIMAAAVNYRQWIYSQFSRHLGRRIVEIGAGIGNFTELFLDRELVVAVDNYEPCVAYMKRRFSGYENIVPLMLDTSAPEMTALARYCPDTIVCINVLEHVNDDRAALSNISKILKGQGVFILLVPAFQFLYGSIDHGVGHYRRYKKSDLKSKLTGAGFNIKEIFYMNSVALFGWFLNNRILKQKEESPSQVIFYDRFIVPWLSAIERVARPPFGLSLIAIAEKEGF